MTHAVRRLLVTLSDESLRLLFEDAEVALPQRDGNAASDYRRLLNDTVRRCSDASRNRIEAVAGEVVALGDKTIFGDMALRSAATGEAAAIATDDSAPLLDRALRVLLRAPKEFRRARNIASGLHWRDGRYHRGFRLSAGGAIQSSLRDAASALAAAVQASQGGRHVDHDPFDYADPLWKESGTPPLVHHVAVYVGAPATSVMEFLNDQDEVARVVRTPAKEVAIDYCPTTGRLDVAGYGIGGGDVLELVAKRFAASALADAQLAQISRREVHLESFARTRVEPPRPPEEFASARIFELTLRRKAEPAGRASFFGARNQTVYDRISEVGVSLASLGMELVRAVGFEFAQVRRDDGETRYVQATLTWPNSLTFGSGVGVEERRRIERWLVAAGWYDDVSGAG